MTPELVSVLVALIALVSSLGGVVITALYASRATKRAQKESGRQLDRKVDAEAYGRARDNYDAALKEQDRRLLRMRDQARDERDTYESERRKDREEHEADMSDMRRRLELLEADRDRDRARIRTLTSDMAALTAWARTLLRQLRGSGVPYASPPMDLGQTDPEGFPPVRRAGT